jgi:hypothetical protein
MWRKNSRNLHIKGREGQKHEHEGDRERKQESALRGQRYELTRYSVNISPLHLLLVSDLCLAGLLLGAEDVHAAQTLPQYGKLRVDVLHRPERRRRKGGAEQT